jgi:hypothetical protein
MTKDEALKLALEALESSRMFVTTREKIKHPEGTEWYDQAITTIKEALAQTEQEPVAWQVMVENEAMKEFSIKDMAHDWCVHQELSGFSYTYWIRPLYTTPPQRTWVELTEDDKVLIKHDANFNQFMTAGEYADRVQALTEARLKDKNT